MLSILAQQFTSLAPSLLLRSASVPLLHALQQRGFAFSAAQHQASAQPQPVDDVALPPHRFERQGGFDYTREQPQTPGEVPEVVGSVCFDYTTAQPQAPGEVAEVVGSVHSIESFSAVDGPGVRFLLFLQGCGLRCVFCSNPDTWHMARGNLTSSKDLASKLERVMPYLNQGDHQGGITISGGEPLLQPEFTAAVLMEAHTRGLTTCIDTTGQGLKHYHWDKVLPHLDYALFCIKSPIPEKYEWITKRKIGPALGFVDELEKRQIPYWLRYVLLPGKTDQPEDVEALIRFCRSKRSMQAIEKWASEGKDYPLAGQRTPSSEEVNAFLAPLKEADIPVLCNKLSKTEE